ncbi:MAG: AAA family ATPase [Acutalibacteraceae bacterium]
MSTERIKTIDGKQLLNLEFEPIKFIVNGLIPQGFHILAGAPKTGKSWLLLLLCLKVSQGEPLWNLTTEKGTVLYLCLEDSTNRIQDRLSELTEEAPDNLHFATSVHCLTEDLSNQIELFIKEHPDTNLIVIDTLQMVRQPVANVNSYATDYKDIGVLKSISDKYGITIIAVQHLRKKYDTDPHQMISGSSGLIGAADGSYVLQKEKIGDDTAKLYIRGRDIEEQVLTIKFNSETKQWEFISTDTPQTDKLNSDSVLSLLLPFMKKENGFIGTATELAEKLGSNIKANVLTRKLSKYRNDLSDIGIEFEKSRSGERRELLLVYEPKGADDDMTV